MKLNIPQLKISKGLNSNIWDSQQNKFIDFSMSNGALLLGHSNAIFKKEIKKKINLGSNFSTENKDQLAYSKKIKNYYKIFEEIYYCNSGSEASLRALRISRAITKKNKFAMISGSWHGSVDNFMFDLNKKNIKIPLSDGIDNSKKDVYMLPQNNLIKSIEILNRVKKKICMIIIEPIQNSFPSEQSMKYVKAIYDFAKKENILVVFDEVVTGLRVKDLAIFKKYKLKPDIVLFAKCFGGGLPIGIIGINKKTFIRMKKLNNKVFLGGTFSGNPLSTSVGAATFDFIKKNKSEINTKLEKYSRKIKKELNDFSKINKFDFQILKYESILRPVFTSKKINSKNDILKYEVTKKKLNFRNYLLKNKIFIPRNGCLFICNSHTYSQINKLIQIIKKYLLSIV
tara:strand:+ start:243 stop:1439 length:1197 start_codon:yes stop_codon:yes gene_type:complete